MLLHAILSSNPFAIIGGMLYVILALVAFQMLCMWKIFEKADKPGWAAIVPIYNIIILLEIVGKPTWWIVLILIPVVNLIVLILIWHQLSLSFGKDGLYTVGLILLGIVFFPMLAFGEAKYVGPGGLALNR
jgi:hypothetical protein